MNIQNLVLLCSILLTCEIISSDKDVELKANREDKFLLVYFGDIMVEPSNEAISFSELLHDKLKEKRVNHSLYAKHSLIIEPSIMLRIKKKTSLSTILKELKSIGILNYQFVESSDKKPPSWSFQIGQ